MKRTKIFLCVLAFMQLSLFSAAATDASLFGEVNAAYKSSAWPGAIDYADTLVSQYPRSPFIAKALSLKAESLYHLGRVEEACGVFEEAISLASDDGELLVRDYYWLGRMYLMRQKLSSAQKNFVRGAAVYRERFSSNSDMGKTSRFYFLNVLWGGRAFYWDGKYKEAVLPFEEVIISGSHYSNSEYAETLSMIYDCYLETKNYKKLLVLHQRLPENHAAISDELRGLLNLLSGDAQYSLKQYRQAYDTYCKVLTGDDSVLASVALQKAYSVASGHPREVGEEPGAVLSNARDGLDEYPELLEEFWTRLGVDAFENGDFSKANSYFENAEKESTDAYTALIGLYKAEMAPDLALTIISDYYQKCDIANAASPSSEYAKAYECAFTKWYAVAENWEQVKVHAKNALSMNGSPAQSKAQIVYWDALASYNLGNLEETRTKILAQTFPEGTELWADSRLLMAQVLYKQGRTLNALRMYEEVNRDFPLKKGDLADYSKLLFADGQMGASYRQSLLADIPDGWYMTALSSFNRREWETSERYFTKYLEKKNQKNTSYAKFYIGYVHYKLGLLDMAVRELSDFISENPSHPLLWNGCMTATNCAVQLSDLNKAASFAKSAIGAAQTVSQKENAITLCASVLADNKKYEEAAAVLAESTKQNDDFGVVARYQLAEIYARNEKLSKSDSLYAEIENKFSSHALADDASYRRGELFYTRENYSQAVKGFLNYQKKFPRGKYLDASYFYCADSYARENKSARAVLQYEALISTMPQSPYIYNAKKNLVVLNRSLGEYSQALSIAESLLADFPQASDSDGIPDQIAELRQLASGINEKMLSLQKAYDAAGKSDSAEGRAAGADLAEYLYESVNTKKDGYSLAKELYAKADASSPKGEESAVAVRCAMIVAGYLRDQNDNSTAASSYLDAARHARASGNSQTAERALYSATEAFCAAGLYGDARETVKNMKELYPKSKFTSKAAALVAKEK